MIETKGNLFDSEDSLVHCISADRAIGAGIAVEFKKRWGVPAIANEENPVGTVATIQDGDRYIFALITKEKYYHKPTYETIQAALLSLASELERTGITSISMPRIGCGLDRLSWNRVRDLIEKILPNINVTVYTL